MAKIWKMVIWHDYSPTWKDPAFFFLQYTGICFTFLAFCWPNTAVFLWIFWSTTCTICLTVSLSSWKARVAFITQNLSKHNVKTKSGRIIDFFLITLHTPTSKETFLSVVIYKHRFTTINRAGFWKTARVMKKDTPGCGAGMMYIPATELWTRLCGNHRFPQSLVQIRAHTLLLPQLEVKFQGDIG